MKVFRVIKNIIVGALMLTFLIFAIAMSVLLLNYNDKGLTQFGDTTLVLVKGDLSSEKYKKGDLVIVQSLKLDSIKPGDEIFTYRVLTNGAVDIELGTVEKTSREENAIKFKNGSTYAMDFVIGKASEKHENLGTVLAIIESKWGFFFIILIPCFIFFLWGVYALIIEIKYGGEDEEYEPDAIEKEKLEVEKNKVKKNKIKSE